MTWAGQPTALALIRMGGGLLVAMSMMRRRSSTDVHGRPGARQGWVQWRAMRRRCLRGRVSGVTSQPARGGPGNAAAMAPSRARSSSAMAGRLYWRCRTVSWCRNTMISRSFERPERTAKRANDTSNRYRQELARPEIGRQRPGDLHLQAPVEGLAQHERDHGGIGTLHRRVATRPEPNGYRGTVTAGRRGRRRPSHDGHRQHDSRDQPGPTAVSLVNCGLRVARGRTGGGRGCGPTRLRRAGRCRGPGQSRSGRRSGLGATRGAWRRMGGQWRLPSLPRR